VARREKPDPQNVLIRETESDIDDIIRRTHCSRFRDQARHRRAYLVDRARPLPIAEIEIQALFGNQAGQEQAVESARAQYLKRCIGPEQEFHGVPQPSRNNQSAVAAADHCDHFVAMARQPPAPAVRPEANGPS
jgi:hypothetical protein